MKFSDAFSLDLKNPNTRKQILRSYCVNFHKNNSNKLYRKKLRGFASDLDPPKLVCGSWGLIIVHTGLTQTKTGAKFIAPVFD